MFIHEAACARHAEDAGFPNDLRAHPLTLQGYGPGRQLVTEEYVRDGHVDEGIERLLARPDILYIHVRDTTAGCYDCRIERAARE